MTNLTIASPTPLRGWPFGLTAFDIWSPFRLYDSYPAYDETDERVTLSFDVPGFKVSEVSIEVDDRLLTVRAKNTKQSSSQSVSLGRELDIDKAEARLEDGQLTISIPKGSRARPKRIEIKS